MFENCSLTDKYYIPLLLPLDIQVQWRSEVCPSFHRNVDLFQLVSLYVLRNEIKTEDSCNKNKQIATISYGTIL